MSSLPMVSVVMPVRNGMPFLPEAVESIRSQSWPNWELIVVDDHSTDGTASYLAQIADPRIRVTKNAGDGFDAARATGIHAARGEFLARMDADDVSMPGRLEMQVSYLTTHPEFVGIGTQVDFIIDRVTVSAFRYPISAPRILANLRSGRVTMCDSSIMFRTRAASHLHARMHGPGADFDFYLRLAAYGKLGNLPQRMVSMRVGTSSMSFSKVDQQLSGIAFALACDRARRSQMPEPDYNEFRIAWHRRPIWQRLITKSRVWHQKLYRFSVMYRAAGRTVQSLACLSASAILWPPAVWHQLERKIRREAPEPYAIPNGPAAHRR